MAKDIPFRVGFENLQKVKGKPIHLRAVSGFNKLRVGSGILEGITESSIIVDGKRFELGDGNYPKDAVLDIGTVTFACQRIYVSPVYYPFFEQYRSLAKPKNAPEDMQDIVSGIWAEVMHKVKHEKVGKYIYYYDFNTNLIKRVQTI